MTTYYDDAMDPTNPYYADWLFRVCMIEDIRERVEAVLKGIGLTVDGEFADQMASSHAMAVFVGRNGDPTGDPIYVQYCEDTYPYRPDPDGLHSSAGEMARMGVAR